MKLVIGANGKIGRRVVEQLLREDRASEKPCVFVRDGERARQNFGDRVEIRIGDLDDRGSIDSALEGVSSLLLCSPVHPDQVKQHNGVIDAARAIGKPHIVKLSGLATFPGSFVDSGRWHAETETYLAASGLPYTCLQPYFFMQNLEFQKERVLKSGKVQSGVAQAAIAMVDAEDIAAAVARVLSEPTLALNETIPLTSRKSLTYAEVATVLSTVWDRDIEFEAQETAEIEANLRKSGQPDWHIQILLQFNRAFEEGLGSQVYPVLERLLGRAPTELEVALRRDGVQASDTDPFPS